MPTIYTKWFGLFWAAETAMLLGCVLISEMPFALTCGDVLVLWGKDIVTAAAADVWLLSMIIIVTVASIHAMLIGNGIHALNQMILIDNKRRVNMYLYYRVLILTTTATMRLLMALGVWHGCKYSPPVVYMVTVIPVRIVEHTTYNIALEHRLTNLRPLNDSVIKTV